MSLLRKTSTTTIGRRLKENIEESISTVLSLEPAIVRASEAIVSMYISSYYNYSDAGNRAPEAVLLTGAPGTGKSSLPIVIALAMRIPYATYTVDPSAITADLFYVEKAEARHAKDGYTVSKSTEDGLFSRTTREANAKGVLPILVINEVDKAPHQVLQPLMQAIPEGIVVSPMGTVHPVNGVIVGTANTREYDSTSRELSTALSDRFSVSELFQPYDEASLERVIRKRGAKKSTRPVDIPSIDQNVMREAINEYPSHLKTVLGNDRLVKCFAGVIAVLSGTSRHKEAAEIASRVTTRPGARASAAMVTYAAGLSLFGYEFDEETVLRILISSLRHRIYVTPGESKESVIVDAHSCACQRTSSGGAGWGISQHQPQSPSPARWGHHNAGWDQDKPSQETENQRANRNVSSFIMGISQAAKSQGSSRGSRQGGGVHGKDWAYVDPSAAASIATRVCSLCNLNPSDAIHNIANGVSFKLAGITFERVGNNWMIYPTTPEAREALSKALSKGLSGGHISVATSYVDFDLVLKYLRLAGGSLEEAVKEPVYWAARAAYTAVKVEGARGRGRISSILSIFGAIVADRIAKEGGGEADKLIRSVERYTKYGSFEGYIESDKPIGKIDVARTAIGLELKGPDAKPYQRIYVEANPKVVLVIDKSGSMDQEFKGFKNVAYAAGIASLIANTLSSTRFDIVAFDTNVYLLGENLESGEAIGTLASIESGSGGTSYANAIDYVSSIAEGGSVVVVVGDFIDIETIRPETLSKISGKDIKIVLCPTPGYDEHYLETLRRELNAEVIYPLKEIF